ERRPLFHHRADEGGTAAIEARYTTLPVVLLLSASRSQDQQAQPERQGNNKKCSKARHENLLCCHHRRQAVLKAHGGRGDDCVQSVATSVLGADRDGSVRKWRRNDEDEPQQRQTEQGRWLVIAKVPRIRCRSPLQ